MLAPRPIAIEPTEAAPLTDPIASPAPSSEPRAPLRSATDEDAASASPVHALQSRLAVEFDSERRRPGFDPMRPLIVAVNIACWWGLISLGMLIAHHWPFR